jgi:general secretion pathway protein G
MLSTPTEVTGKEECKMRTKRPRRNKGFSLLELVIVVVIIGIIAAIAIPRMSRGSAGAADSALIGDLAVLRSAIDLYAAEHNGANPTDVDIANQLTQYTDPAGVAQAGKDATHIYGPYVRKIPPLPVGANKNNTGIAAADGPGVGWIYTEGTGDIRSNTDGTEKDVAGKLYSDY